MQAVDKSIQNSNNQTFWPSLDNMPYKKNMIRKCKRTFRQFKKANIYHYWLKYKTIRNNVV